MEGVFLLLGSNLGDRKQNLVMARQMVEEIAGPVVTGSGIYETEPWGYLDQPFFYNQIIEVSTWLSPHDLLLKLISIEKKLGRTKVAKWKERLIDIDILYFGDRIIQDPQLTIPHPEITNRRFTLIPMAEIAPELLHPKLGITQKDLLENCQDKSAVKKIDSVSV